MTSQTPSYQFSTAPSTVVEDKSSLIRGVVDALQILLQRLWNKLLCPFSYLQSIRANSAELLSVPWVICLDASQA